MSAVEIEGVRKNFGIVETLKNIDLSLESGEFLVLLGSSGCGKSTLLNIIAGLSDATSGEIRIGGRSILGVHPKDRDIAMVFQSYALYPNLTVERNIGFGLEMRKVPKNERYKAVREVANLLQIEPLLARKPAQLSGGQRQRVAIGRALVRNPQVFLFDEPLSNLDAKLRMEMRTELKRLHQLLKTTVIYVTHDQIEAMTLATRIAVMREGHIEQFGTPDEIYNKPASVYVASFVGAPPMNLLNVTVAENGFQIDGTPIVFPFGSPPSSFSRGQELIAGIRPEALFPDVSGSLEVTCDVVELTGPELIMTGSAGSQRILAAFPPRTVLRAGESLTLGFEPGSWHFFDRSTKRRCDS
ncbi:sn-glycerol-3-phosphate ABC transporter ATP-binding protein UgpC [Brucella sp. HL-2]|nr:sn-glycerol-3-phosphate ABC transporter ATP-binding protein UgpC [Brucella sp. HL-2]MCV9907675.1 sn-glycerol-3-phosphate ABC transporter ATP-binding protein UgpC [Brucella sp. HL-2]